MSLTLVLVSSVNGYITNGSKEGIYNWTSQEDQRHFFDLVKSHSIIIMGKNTYLANKSVIKLEAGKLRVVLTTQPEEYKSHEVPGQLEFSDEESKELLNRLQKNEAKDFLLVGGSQVASLFLEAGVVDYLFLTIEPILFGQGLPMLSEFLEEVPLQLEEVVKMNKKGTLLLKYKVL